MIPVSCQHFEDHLLTGLAAGGRQRSRHERLLYEKYRYLTGWASGYYPLGPDECASAYSDAVLSVIIQLASGSFDGRSSLTTYLHQVFRNKCVDALRQKQNRRNRVHQTQGLDQTLLGLPDPARSVVERLIMQQAVIDLRHQLAQVECTKRALLLAWGEGYSDAELARQFGYRSAAVVKTTRLRCLRQLRLRLKPPLV